MNRLMLAVVFLLSFPVFGQAVRYQGTVYTINSSAPQPGAIYPVLAYTSATVQICNYSTTVACPSVATTYTDATDATACPTNAQLTPSTGGSCTASVDSTGNFGAWLLSGNYQYNVTTAHGTYGPYAFTVNTVGLSTGFVTPASGGIVATFAQCTAGLPCGVIAGINSPADTGRPNVSGGYLQVNNSGTQNDFFYNPYFGSAGNNVGWDFFSTNCVQDHANAEVNGTQNGPTQANCFHQIANFSIDEPNYGAIVTTGIQTGGSYIMHGQEMELNCYAAGICAGHNDTIVDSSNGDMQLMGYAYGTYYVNGVASGGENAYGIAHHLNESGTNPYGTIVTGGAGATALTITCLNDCAHPGNERNMIDWSNPLANGYVTASASFAGNTANTLNQLPGLSSITVTETLPVSTYQGTAADTVDVTFVDNSPVATLTWLRTTDGSLTSITTGQMIGIAGREQTAVALASSAVPTWSSLTPYANAVGVIYGGVPYVSLQGANTNHIPSSSPTWWASRAAGSGQHTTAVNLVYPVAAASAVFAGGTAGYGVLFDANNPIAAVAYPSLSGSQYPVRSIGSTNSHTAVLQWPYFGRNQIGNAIYDTIPIGTITTSGGVATINFAGDPNNTRTSHPWVLNAGSIAVTGNSNSALNTQYTVVSGETAIYAPSTVTATPCTAYSATVCTVLTGSQTGTGGTAALLTIYGNTHHTFLPIAMVRSVNDPSITAAQIGAGVSKVSGNYFAIDPTPGTFMPGNTALLALSPFTTSTDYFSQYGANNPYRASEPIIMAIGGDAITVPTGLGVAPAAFHVISYVNSSMLQGGGGPGILAPGGINLDSGPNIGGVFNYGLSMFWAPWPNYASVIKFGCPASPLGCSDTTYVTPIFTASGRTSSGQLNWSAYNSLLTVAGVTAFDFTSATSVYLANIYADNGTVTAHNTWNFPDSLSGVSAGAATSVCAAGTAGGIGLCRNSGIQYFRYVGGGTTTANASDVFSIASSYGVTSSSHCLIEQSGSSVAAVGPFRYVPATNQVTVYHVATASATIEISCDVP